MLKQLSRKACEPIFQVFLNFNKVITESFMKQFIQKRLSSFILSGIEAKFIIDEKMDALIIFKSVGLIDYDYDICGLHK